MAKYTFNVMAYHVVYIIDCLIDFLRGMKPVFMPGLPAIVYVM